MNPTHKVFNQPEPLVDVNLFSGNCALQSALKFNAPALDTAPLHSLGALARNLGRLDAQLAGAGQPALEPSLAQTDSSLFDRSPRSWRDALARVRGQLSSKGML